MEIDYLARGDHTVPTRGSEKAAGWDLSAAMDITLHPYIPTLVPTNLEIAIPVGHMLLVLPRSGNSLKKNLLIPNSPGLIDEDYRGHLQVILSWIPHPAKTAEIKKSSFKFWDKGDPVEFVQERTLVIAKGERIAQAVLLPYVVQNWCPKTELPPTQRGSGGFGSTG